MGLWRHMSGWLEGPWKGGMDAWRAHVWLPSSASLRPACIQGHLLTNPPYLHSFLFHPVLVCIISINIYLSCMILN